ncbi:MAG: Gx transporter family protein [Acidaminococcaceae bacterium]|nr:Gx transporter family protein [Acidaminococcaceae bacterium]
MPSSAKYSLQTLTRLSVLLAGAIALRLIESAFAYLLPLPGAHLGLANCVTIIVLYMYTTGQAALFLTARILLVGLLFTGLLTPGFTIGLGGALFSFIFMALAVKHNWFSAWGNWPFRCFLPQLRADYGSSLFNEYCSYFQLSAFSFAFRYSYRSFYRFFS